ncbi:MAG: DUF1080 domain-containing protein [Vicinamibacterales bacterium]
MRFQLSVRTPSAWTAGFVLMGVLASASLRADIPPGFTRIFDGKTTKGWHFSGTVHHGTTGIATVTKDGVLQLTQRPFGQGGLFLTDKIYKNFELYLEVRVPFSTNSGIFLRSSEAGSAYQVELVQGGSTGQLLGENLRLSQGIPAPDLSNIWKTDDFNSVRVRMDGDAPRVTIWINGTKTGEVQEPRNDQVGGVVGGRIGLQLHWLVTYEPASVSGGGMSNTMKPGHPIGFRNIAIKELP